MWDPHGPGIGPMFSAWRADSYLLCHQESPIFPLIYACNYVGFSLAHLFLAVCYHMHWETVRRTFEHFAMVIILLKSKDFFPDFHIAMNHGFINCFIITQHGFPFSACYSNVLYDFSSFFPLSSLQSQCYINVTYFRFLAGSSELLAPISESVIYCHSSAAWRIVNPNDTHQRTFLSPSSSVDLLLLLLRAGLSRAPASKVSSQSARWLCWFWTDSLMHLGLQLGQLLGLAVLHLFSRRPAWSCFHGEAEGQEEEQKYVRLFERQPWKQHKSLPLCAIEWRKS